MPIVKDGKWIAIDSVEADSEFFEGTGRPNDELKLTNPWKTTLNAWKTVGAPPTEKDNKFYAIKNGEWQVVDSTASVNVVDGKNSHVVSKGDDIAIDVNISPDLDGDVLDFTK